MKIIAGWCYNVWKWDILIIYLKMVSPYCSSLPCCRGGNTIYIFQILCISRRSHRTVHLRLVVSTEEEKDVPTDGRGGHRLVAHLEHCRHNIIIGTIGAIICIMLILSGWSPQRLATPSTSWTEGTRGCPRSSSPISNPEEMQILERIRSMTRLIYREHEESEVDGWWSCCCFKRCDEEDDLQPVGQPGEERTRYVWHPRVGPIPNHKPRI